MPAVQAGTVPGHKPPIIGHKPPKAPKPSKIAKPVSKLPLPTSTPPSTPSKAAVKDPPQPPPPPPTQEEVLGEEGVGRREGGKRGFRGFCWDARRRVIVCVCVCLWFCLFVCLFVFVVCGEGEGGWGYFGREGVKRRVMVGVVEVK